MLGYDPGNVSATSKTNKKTITFGGWINLSERANVTTGGQFSNLVLCNDDDNDKYTHRDKHKDKYKDKDKDKYK